MQKANKKCSKTTLLFEKEYTQYTTKRYREVNPIAFNWGVFTFGTCYICLKDKAYKIAFVLFLVHFLWNLLLYISTTGDFRSSYWMLSILPNIVINSIMSIMYTKLLTKYLLNRGYKPADTYTLNFVNSMLKLDTKI